MRKQGRTTTIFGTMTRRSGRYLSPDPVGPTGGTNPFAYVHNNPHTGVDSLGLYDERVHYYMTYFLGLVAGLPQDVARTMATAAQYVDDNFQTEPIHAGVIPNLSALSLYHFVLDYDRNNYGDWSSDPMTRFYFPSSAQLSRLANAADEDVLRQLWAQANANACPAPWTIDDARYQLYGEFLHSFQDTFSHRDINNVSYAAFNTPWRNYPESMLGHGGGEVLFSDLGHAPDHTYNQEYAVTHSSCTLPRGRGSVPNLSEAECLARGGVYTPSSSYNWASNELRTLRMEYEVFNRIQTDFADLIAANRNASQPAFGWSDLAGHSEWQYGHDQANARIGMDQSFEQWAQSQGFDADRRGLLLQSR